MSLNDDYTLIIPNVHKGKEVTDISFYDIKSYYTYSRIRKIICNMRNFYMNKEDILLLSNVRELEINGILSNWYSDIIKEFKNLEKISINRLSTGYYGTDKLFSGFEYLRDVYIKCNESTVIAEETFADCINLRGEYIIPKGTTVIMENAFRNCKSLGKIVLPNSLISLDKSAFLGCSKLKQVEINSLVAITNDKDDRGNMFEDGVEVRCNVDYPIDFLKSICGDITIKHKLKEIDDARLLKAGLLGIDVVCNDIPNNKEQLLGNIKLIDYKAWKRGLYKLFINYITSDSETTMGLMGTSPIFTLAEIDIRHRNCSKNNRFNPYIGLAEDESDVRRLLIDNLDVRDNFIYTHNNNVLLLLPLDKNIAIKNIKSYLVGKIMYNDNLEKCVAEIPLYYINNFKGRYDIEYKDGNIIIRDRGDVVFVENCLK